MKPDYSRQLQLKEIGTRGQAVLERSRVLIVGAGGLGSPVIQYLAGAGVGHLGVVDADLLDASNLHRQPIYALADVGRPKAALACAAARAINPAVEAMAHELRLTADNAVALIAAHDLVIDCTDNFRAKFLINDAAVVARKPAVFASVYQYEGQLQAYKPEAGHSCLRCLWPNATADGIVGNCAAAGVLGPVPGVLGSLQALLALKILLGLPGQLAGELLLLDFTTFDTSRLKSPRRRECQAPGCALIEGVSPEEPDLEVAVGSLEEAGRSFEVIDIRSREEVTARPTGTRHIAMAELLAKPELLADRGVSAGPAAPPHADRPARPADSGYLLLCATGRRSLATARELRKLGLPVHSLAGGLDRIAASLAARGMEHVDHE